MSQNKMKLCLIGAGSIAASYTQAISMIRTAELVGIADVRRHKAESLASICDCRAFSSFSEMVEELTPQAAIICTPPSTHRDISLDLAERGIHLLCEKPFSTSEFAAREMIDAARSAPVIIMVGSKFRYMDDIVHARHLIGSGILGEIRRITIIFSRVTPMKGRWYADREISGGGVIIDNGTHSLDILRFLAGPLSRVLAHESGRTQGLAVEENAHLLVETFGGTGAEIELSWNLSIPGDEFLSVSGTQGEVVIGWKQSLYRLHSSPESMVFGTGYDKMRVLGSQVENFIGAIQGIEEARISLQDILSQVMAVDAAYRSLSNGEWIALPAIEEGHTLEHIYSPDSTH
jgi:predicted dehydrogenase